MSRLVLAACAGAAAYILLRPPRDDPLDDFEYAPPAARAVQPPVPPPAAAKSPETAPVPQQPVQQIPIGPEPVDALLLGILRFVGLQIFISVLVVLAVSLFLGAENGRTVGIGAFGIFSVFTFSALAQMRLQVRIAHYSRSPCGSAVHGFCSESINLVPAQLTDMPFSSDIPRIPRHARCAPGPHKATVAAQVRRRQLVFQQPAPPSQKLPPPSAPSALSAPSAPRPSPFAERASTMTALETAEAMIASMGGPKPPPPPQDLTGSWDKVRTTRLTATPCGSQQRMHTLLTLG